MIFQYTLGHAKLKLTFVGGSGAPRLDTHVVYFSIPLGAKRLPPPLLKKEWGAKRPNNLARSAQKKEKVHCIIWISKISVYPQNFCNGIPSNMFSFNIPSDFFKNL
jgi:hypothetical protein